MHQFELISTWLLPNVSTQRNSSTTVRSIRSGSEWKNPSIRPTDYIFNSGKIDIWQRWGLFGRTRLRKKAISLGTCGNPPEVVISQEKCLLFIPSFLRTAFELRYYGAFPQIPRTLTFFPVLPHDAAEFQLCRPQHMEAFKQALSRREISPFALSNSGETLLHIASGFNHAELCSLLIRIGVDPDHTDVIGNKALHSVKHFPGSVVDTMRVLATAQDELTLHDLACVFGFFFEGSPESAGFLLSAYGSPNGVDWAEVSDFSLLRTALREYGNGRREWDTWIRKWLPYEADIHSRRLWPINGFPGIIITPLDEIFFHGDDPFQASSYGREWLLMLAEAGYNVNAYLKKEKQLHSTQKFLTYPTFGTHIRRQLVFETGESSNVSWEWWIDPSSLASLVLQEFRYMNLCHNDKRLTGHNCWGMTWPYDYPRRSEPKLKQWRKRADKAASRYTRQAKSKYPGDFKDNNEDAIMPGAWIED